MQYDAPNPAQYIEALADDWRKTSLLELRQLIESIAPDLQEGIHYKMLSYSDDDKVLFHLNAQKHYVSLYVGDAEKIDPNKQWLTGLDVGKGCIRFKKSNSVSDSKIDQFISHAIVLHQQGHNFDC